MAKEHLNIHLDSVCLSFKKHKVTFGLGASHRFRNYEVSLDGSHRCLIRLSNQEHLLRAVSERLGVAQQRG